MAPRTPLRGDGGRALAPAPFAARAGAPRSAPCRTRPAASALGADAGGAATGAHLPLPHADAVAHEAATATVEAAPARPSRAEAQASRAAPPPAAPPAPRPAPLGEDGAWVWALAIVAAVRLGRMTAEDARLDVRRVQGEREQRRALSKELRLRREAWRLEQAERSAAEDAARVAEAARRARDEAARAREAQAAYRAEAAKAAAAAAAEREAQRARYEEEQRRMDAEYRARAEAEAAVIAEARARARAEEERRRAEEEAARAAAEAERAAREEAERAARVAAARAKAEARAALEREKKKFVLRLSGAATVERAPKGAVVPGPLPRDASVRASVGAASLLAAPAPPAAADLASAADVGDALPALAGRAARGAADAAASAFRLQSVAGEGPLAWMDDAELRYWMAAAAARAAVAALAAGQAAAREFAAQGGRAAAEAPYEARTEHGVLPADHPQRLPAALDRVIAAVEAGAAAGEWEGAPWAEALDELLDGATDAFYAGLPAPLPEGVAGAPPFMGAALAVALLLDRALAERAARSSDAPAWFEGVAALARRALRRRTAGAPPDSLRVPAALLGAALGEEHPVAREAAELADANLSAGARRARDERRRLDEAALAAALLEEEWPDEGELRAARAADRDAKTPVPERVWALRNVAGALALGGPGERGRARQLLEQAVRLKQAFAGAPDHPGALPELAALQELLAREPEWAADAAGVASLVLRALRAVAAAYAAAGDATSAVVLLEAGLRRYEEAAGVRSAAVRGATREADALLAGMPEAERAAAIAARRSTDAVLGAVTGALTEELGAYRAGGGRSRAQEWDERGVAMLGPLRFGEEAR